MYTVRVKLGYGEKEFRFGSFASVTTLIDTMMTGTDELEVEICREKEDPEDE